MVDISALVRRERLQETFCRLVSIDSPSFDEREMADAVKTELKTLGLDAIEDKAAEHLHGSAGNLLVRIPGAPNLSPLMFAAHLDTVPPARRKRAVCHPDGKITSCGDTVLGADDLSAVAEILEAVRVLQENNIRHRPLELLFFSAEEPYTAGSRRFDFSSTKAKEAYILDLEGAPGKAALRAPTILYFKITVHGKASHAGFAPEAGIHAVKIAAEAIAELPLGRLDEETTFGIGTIGGGLAPNIIPESCVIEGEIRGYNDEKVQNALAHVAKVFAAKAASAGGSTELETEQRTTAYSVKEDSSLVDRFCRACHSSGLNPELGDTFGGSDASSSSKAGISSLVISNGMHRIHSTEEYTSSFEMAKTAELILNLILEL